MKESINYIQDESFNEKLPYWYVECRGATFRSNLSLNDAMCRWALHYDGESDTYVAQVVGRVM